MKPTRRVLVGIGVLLLSMFASVLLAWQVQTRALSGVLVADIEVTLGRAIERAPKLAGAKHENGYACFAAAVESAA